MRRRAKEGAEVIEWQEGLGEMLKVLTMKTRKNSNGAFRGRRCHCNAGSRNDSVGFPNFMPNCRSRVITEPGVKYC